MSSHGSHGSGNIPAPSQRPPSPPQAQQIKQQQQMSRQGSQQQPQGPYRLVKWAGTWQNQQSDYTPSKDSDQPGHLPSLIRVFPVRMKKAWVLSYLLSAQWRRWSDWVDAQADLSLRWAHTHLVGFVMSWLKCHQNLKNLFTRKNCCNYPKV